MKVAEKLCFITLYALVRRCTFMHSMGSFPKGIGMPRFAVPVLGVPAHALWANHGATTPKIITGLVFGVLCFRLTPVRPFSLESALPPQNSLTQALRAGWTQAGCTEKAGPQAGAGCAATAVVAAPRATPYRRTPSRTPYSRTPYSRTPRSRTPC